MPLPTDGRAICRIGIKIEICRHELFFEGSGRLRGNVRTSSIARWKARVRLPIRHN